MQRLLCLIVAIMVLGFFAEARKQEYRDNKYYRSKLMSHQTRKLRDDNKPNVVGLPSQRDEPVMPSSSSPDGVNPSAVKMTPPSPKSHDVNSQYYVDPQDEPMINEDYALYDTYDMPKQHRKSRSGRGRSHRSNAPSSSDGIFCTDSLGNKIQWSPGRPDLFKLIISRDKETITVSCAQGSFFSLRSCSCEVMPDDNTDSRQCLIYLPFNDNLSDYSIQRFSTVVEGTGKVVVERKTVASGTGSGRFDKKTRVDVPGRLKTTSRMQFTSSWCTFFRCENTENSFNCEENGGLITSRTNNRQVPNQSITSTFTLAVQQQNTVTAKLVYDEATGDSVVLEGRFNKTNDNGFVHVCVTHDSVHDRLYINKNVISTKKSLGKLLPVSGPYSIGYSPKQGYFKGLIDEVIVCDHTMNPEEVGAHCDGQKQYLVTRGYIPVL